MTHAIRALLLAAAALAVFSCDASKPAEGEQSGSTETKLVSAFALSEACARAAAGTTPISAAAIGAPGAPLVSIDTAYGVRLPPGPSGNAGLLSFRATMPGDYQIFLGTPNVPFVVRDGNALVPITESARLNDPGCDALRRDHTVRLQAGRTYTIQLGPLAPASWVRLVVEPANDPNRACTSADLPHQAVACALADLGPERTVLAAPRASATPPAIALSTPTVVELRPANGVNEGAAAFTPDADAFYEFYLGTPKIPFTIPGANLRPSCTSRMSDAACPLLKRSDAYFLRAGISYQLQLGPLTGGRFVRVLIETADSRVDECALGTHSCDRAPTACIDRPVGYECVCPARYEGYGIGSEGCHAVTWPLLEWPPSGVTSAARVVARGRASDANGAPLTSIQVNGISATIAADGSWSLPLSLAPGENTIHVSATSAAGNPSETTSVTLIREPLWNEIGDLVFDAASNHTHFIAAAADGSSAIFTAGATGIVSILSGAEAGTGEALGNPRRLALDAAAHRLLVSTADKLLAVDATTGNRSLISGAARGTGPQLPLGDKPLVDQGRALISTASGLFAVDFASGDRSLLVPASITHGDRALGLDPARTRILLLSKGTLSWLDLTTSSLSELAVLEDASSSPNYRASGELDWSRNRAVIAWKDFDTFMTKFTYVNLTTGEQKTRVPPGWPSQLQEIILGGPVLDIANDRILVTDAALDAVLAVDGKTGNISSIAEPSLGSGVSGLGVAPPKYTLANAAKLQLRNGTAWRLNIFDNGLANDDRNKSLELISTDLATGNRTLESTPDDLDATGHEVLAVDSNQPRLYYTMDRYNPDDPGPHVDIAAFDTHSKQEFLVSDGADSNGPTMRATRAMVVQGDRLLALDPEQQALFAVDINGGLRSILSDAVHGSGPGLTNPIGLATLDDDHALTLDAATNAVIGIELSSGDRTILSLPGARGSGPLFQAPRDLDIDAIRSLAYVVDSALDALIRVDLLTGDRTIVTSAAVGRGTALDPLGTSATGPQGISIDATHQRALVTTNWITGEFTRYAGGGVLLFVDLTNGDRLAL